MVTIRKILLFLLFFSILKAEYFTGENGGECVNYARFITGNNLSTSPYIGGDLGAYHIYDLWDYGYGRGNIPQQNSLIVLDKWGSNPSGHVGIVRKIVKYENGTYDLYVDESNWYKDKRIIKNAHYFFDSNIMKVKREWNKEGYMHPPGEVDSPLGSSWYPVRGFVYTQPTDIVTRAEALKLIFDKFKITPTNAGFNQYIFGEPIIPPQDVDSNTPYYPYIVTAFNRGIVRGDGGNFYPDKETTLAVFLKMIVKTIPIPLNNPNYEDYYGSAIGKWYYPYVKAAYNAGILENKDYNFEEPLNKELANNLLDKAYDYFLGNKSGISIYIRWKTEYADMDLYLFSPYDDNLSTNIEYDDNFNVLNMDKLRNSNGIVYWNHHNTNWGANLDYDSWGGNGNQPWGGFGEERITVDSQMVRRPGEYSIIICYYNWRDPKNPDSASVDLWGIQRGKLINDNGEKFHYIIKKGTCRYVATLST